MHALYHPTLNGGKASDWLRPIPCQQGGNKLSKGAYQSGNGYSTRVHLPGHLACDPSSQRKASHISSQGKEVVFVTHDIYLQYVQYVGQKFYGKSISHESDFFFKEKSMPVGNPHLRLLLTGILQEVLL